MLTKRLSSILTPGLMLGLALGLAGSAHGKPAGPGNRNFLPSVTVAPADWAKKVIVADFNRDGKNDFAVLHWEIDGRGAVDGISLNKGYLVRVYLNTTSAPVPNPTFVRSADLLNTDDALRIYPMYNNDVTSGDFNGDGIPDLIVANAHADRVFTYLGKGDGTFSSPVETVTDDDPCYVAAGDYDADGKTDIALMHFIRGFPGNNYQWRFAFLFGLGDGTFDRKVTRDEGNFSFAGGRGPGPYFYSSAWNFENAAKGVQMGDGSLRDAVWLNNDTHWFDGAAIQGDFKPSQFDKQWGSKATPLLDPTASDLLDFGGRVVATRKRKLGDSLLSQYDFSLDRFFVDLDGNSRVDRFGKGVVGADFDNDGAIDLALASDELGGPGHRFDPDQSSYTFLIAYGKHTLINPLNADKTGFDLQRFKEIYSGGIWKFGHRPSQTEVADFNLDQYPDLITLTAGGVVVHPNQGLFGFQAQPPILSDISGLGAQDGGGTAAGDPLRLFGIFDTGGRPVISMIVTSTVAPIRRFSSLVLPDRAMPLRSVSASLPPDDIVEPGDYLLSVYNGTSESLKKFPVKVVLRPLSLSGFDLKLPDNGASSANLVVRGWFGSSDLASTRFTIEQTGKPATAFAPPVTDRSAGAVTLRIPTSTPAGSYTLRASNPRRKGAELGGVAIDFTPRITNVAWLNPGAPGYVSNPALPIEPGALFEIEGRMFRAPDLQRWRLLRGGTTLLEGTGMLVIRGGVADANTNIRSYFVFTLPAGVSDGTVSLQVIAENGLESPPAGPFGIVKKTGGGGGGGMGTKDFFFARESLTSTICDTYGPVKAKDDAEALSLVKLTVVNPADYVFTKIEQPETTTACGWDWEYDLEDSGGTVVDKTVVDAASRAIADIKATTRAPSGGKAVYQKGPVK